MHVAALGHTSGAATSWIRGEMQRVLLKLAPDTVYIAVDLGYSIEWAEAAVLCDLEVVLVPLVSNDRWLRYVRGHPGLERRWVTVSDRASRFTDTDVESVSRAVRHRQHQLLRDQCDTHLLVYDGRHHGSIFTHLNQLYGTHDVIVLDPSTNRTVRLPKE